MKVAKIDVLNVMTSQEIAELVDSRHDVVKLSIERLAGRSVIQLPPLVEVKNHLGQKVEIYQIGKRDSYVIVAQLSPEFTARLVDRWQELELQQSARIEEESARLHDRQTARLECHDLTKAIEDRYTRRGTKPATYNFSNEFNMINKIVLGETAKKFKESHGLDPNAMLRDYLSAIEIKAVLDLQATSRVLCDLDFNYDQRKEKLTKLFDQKYRDAMLAEIIRLES